MKEDPDSRNIGQRTFYHHEKARKKEAKGIYLGASENPPRMSIVNEEMSL